SPRADGSIPASRSARSAPAAPPAQGASATRRVLRRWANAASTTANTSSRLAVVFGGSRRTSATRPESTFGTGQNTLRPTDPARRTSANQAIFTDGTPYSFDPGWAVSRSATSACTMTRPRRSDGSTANRWSRIGTTTLYGRFATSASGATPRSSGPIRSASARTTRSRPATSGAYSATVTGSRSASTGSTSTATTCAASGSRARVSEPSPGPTLRTTS